jgi:hypothetical protein
VDWIQLARDRNQWRAAVSAVMNLQVLAPWSQSVIYNHFVTKVLKHVSSILINLHGIKHYSYVNVNSIQ